LLGGGFEALRSQFGFKLASQFWLQLDRRQIALLALRGKLSRSRRSAPTGYFSASKPVHK
jgi:CII-binding regulator of phage lambda lysogenization HflD